MDDSKISDQLSKHLSRNGIFIYSMRTNTIRILYKLFLENTTQDITEEESLVHYYYGIYYEKIQHYDDMIKYYLQAIERGSQYAFRKLCEYYRKNKLLEQEKECCIKTFNTPISLEGINYINKILNEDFDVIFALKIIDKLDDRNLKLLNKFLDGCAISSNGFDLVNKQLTDEFDIKFALRFRHKLNDENMRTLNQHLTCDLSDYEKDYINRILYEDFDVNLAIQVRDKLNSRNLKLLSKFLAHQFKPINGTSEILTDVEECPICLDDANLIILKCSHKMCTTCLDKLITQNISSCHYCYQSIYSS